MATARYPGERSRWAGCIGLMTLSLLLWAIIIGGCVSCVRALHQLQVSRIGSSKQ